MYTRTASFLGALLLISTVVVSDWGNAPAAASPTPGLNCETAGTPAGAAPLRYFPEAEQTNDYVGFFEFEDCIEKLNAAYPDRMEIKVTGKSYGHMSKVTQQRVPQNVYLIEVTNEKSPIPFDDKAKVVLMLSIHGNEKGGREGGMRVLEDLVRNMGVAQQEVTGHPGVSLYELLDYTVLLLLFPNPDGWVLDEPEFYDPNACGGTMYCRGNAHGADLNRQLPTIGWHRATDGTRKTLNEPEPIGYANALVNYTKIYYAADIHGMLTPADGCAYGVCSFTSDASMTGENVYGHFVLGLISAGQLTPVEMLRSTRLANILDDRLNDNPAFVGWNEIDQSTSVWGGEYYQWSTVWDTIGYTDSGISGDWFLQNTGLNAPGMDFEMAYNHMTFDSNYPGPAQLAERYHIETVRQIAKAYLEAAVTDVQTSVEAHGKTTAYLYNPKVLTSQSDRPLEGWAADNHADDRWDYAHVPYQAAPADYFREMRPFVIDGDVPAVFEEVEASKMTLDRINQFDNFIVAGSSAALINQSAANIQTLKSFVEAGGNLILTDDSLSLLGALGLVTPAKIDFVGKYAGMTLLTDRDHPFAANSVKLSRQTYEPVPLGYGLSNGAPNWYVNRTEFEAKGGETVGVVPLNGLGRPDSLAEGPLGGSVSPQLDAGDVSGETNVGRIKLGLGTVSFIGSLLPDPTQENYHPYGLSSYATTYFGNLILYNMMGAEQVFTQPPIVLEDVGQVQHDEFPEGKRPAETTTSDETGGGSPGFEAVVALGAALAVAVFVGRRRQ